MSEKPLTPWLVCEKSGKVLSVHCDCMAGLGESCSYFASLLWAIEAGCKRRDYLTVTEKKAYWVLPPAVKSDSLQCFYFSNQRIISWTPSEAELTDFF